MLTSKELAKLIGVSQPTISRVLNGGANVSPKTREYVLQMIEKYRYTPSSTGRMLKTRRTNMVGILLQKHFESYTNNMMLTYVYDLLQKELIASQYDILLVHEQRDEAVSSSFERIVKGRKIDGLISMRPLGGTNEALILEEEQIPYVTIYNGSSQGSDIWLDGESAGRVAGEFFGRQEPCHYMAIMERHNYAENARRLNGFRSGLGKYQRVLQDDSVFYCDLSVSSAYDTILTHRKLFPDRKISMLVYNDMLAFGVLNALRNLNIPVPEQVQTISFDGIPLGQSLHPHLTTLQAPAAEMVRHSVQALLELMNGDRAHVHPVKQEKLNYTLVEGETTRKVGT